MEMKTTATITGKDIAAENNLMTLQGDDDHHTNNISPPSAVAAAAATATMKTLENSTNTINNASSSSFVLNSKDQHGHSSGTAAEANMNNPYTTVYAVAELPTGQHHPHPKEREPTHRDVILNDCIYGNPKFHTWIQEHREAFSLATSLSSQTILIQGLIQVSLLWWKEVSLMYSAVSIT
jgi:hypothetical protein